MRLHCGGSYRAPQSEAHHSRNFDYSSCVAMDPEPLTAAAYKMVMPPPSTSREHHHRSSIEACITRQRRMTWSSLLVFARIWATILTTITRMHNPDTSSVPYRIDPSLAPWRATLTLANRTSPLLRKAYRKNSPTQWPASQICIRTWPRPTTALTTASASASAFPSPATNFVRKLYTLSQHIITSNLGRLQDNIHCFVLSALYIFIDPSSSIFRPFSCLVCMPCYETLVILLQRAFHRDL